MSDLEPNDDFVRIARFVAGELDASERDALERELKSNPVLAADVESARRGWDAAGRSHPVNVDAAWGSVRRRIQFEGTGVVDITRKRQSWRPSGVMLRAAAAVTLIVASTVVWENMYRSPSITAVTASTRIAEQRTVRLPDGTEVVLSAASSLRTLGTYGDGAREVALEGEASFVVTHDEERPFRIHTPTALIEDLGTAFTVRAVSSQAVRVAVTEGVVRVRRTGADEASAVVLQPRDVAVVADTGDPIVSRGVEVEHFKAWSRGRLEFRNTPFTDVIADLERWYDVEFQVTDSTLLARELNVPFDRQSIDEVLEVIGTSLDVKFERRGRVITLAPPLRTGLRYGQPAVQVGSGA